MSRFGHIMAQKKNIKIQRPKTFLPINEENDQDIFTVSYDYNFPFFEVHSFLIQSLHNKRGLSILIKEYEENIKNYNENKSQNRDFTKKKIINLKNKIKDLKSGKTLDNYLEESFEIIEKLNKTVNLLPDLFEINNNNENNYSILKKEDEDQIILINDFINITLKYVKINFIKEQNQDVDHCSCGHNLTNVFVNEFGEQICPNCDNIRYDYCNFNVSMGGKNIKLSGNSRTCLAVNTFKRELNNFMGQQKVDIPEIVYNLLDEWMQANGLPPSAEIRKLPRDEYGKTENTSLEQLINGLNAIGYPALYKHANKIGKKLLNWELHDLRKYPMKGKNNEIEYVDLLPELCKDFIETQKEFYNVEKGERTSNICNQYRILQHLRLKKVHVCISDFKLLSPQTLKNSERIWKRMVLRAGLEYMPLFPNENEEIEEEGFIIVKNDKEVLYIGAEDNNSDNDNDNDGEEKSFSFSKFCEDQDNKESYFFNLNNEYYDSNKNDQYDNYSDIDEF
jgi:hypothetical protein